MSYYYDPTVNVPYQNTKRQIQLSIKNLQEKLRRRKSYEIEMLRDQQQMLNRMSPSTKRHSRPQFWENHYQPFKFNPVYHRQQELDIGYLPRMRKLQQQRQLFYNQRELAKITKYDVQRRQIGRRLDFGVDHDDSLIRKYQDGTKIREYNDEIDQIRRYRQIQKLSNDGSYRGDFVSKSTQHLHKYNQKNYEQQANANIHYPYDNNAFSSLRKKQLGKAENRVYQQYKTPYNKLQANIHHPQLQLKNNGFSSKVKQRRLDYSPQQTNLKNKYKNDVYKENINGSQKNQNIDKISNFPMYSQKKLGFSPSPQEKSPIKKNNTNRKHSMSNSKLSRKHSNSNLHNHQKIQKSNISMMRESQNILKRIQNRLKLSQIVYQDSKFKNIKHQLNHLFMTYENQCKARDDIRQKINKGVSKKYGLVV